MTEQANERTNAVDGQPKNVMPLPTLWENVPFFSALLLLSYKLQVHTKIHRVYKASMPKF